MDGASLAKRLHLDSGVSKDVSNGVQVKKRTGTDNKGFDYEKYMLLWVLLKLLEEEDVQEFYITDNVDGMGAFDDVIIKVKRKTSGGDDIVRELICVQLKHKETTTKKITWQDVAGKGKGPYKLQKYFEGYKEIHGLIKKFNDPILDECLEQEVTLVMYTNTSFEFAEDTFDANSFCRRILETESPSTVFTFNGEEKNETLWKKIQDYNKPFYAKKAEISEFIKKVVFFSNQNDTTLLKKNLENTLKNYGNCENISPEDALQRAVRFITENSSMWLSRHSGVLFNVTINFQGFQVKLNDMQRQRTNPELWRKLIIKHICQEKGSLVSVGKTIDPPIEHYIERKVENDIVDTNILEQEFIILSAPPGMGKSEFFTQTAFQIKNSNPLKYVIRENLLSHTEYLNQVTDQPNTLATTDKKKLAEDFLQELAGVKTGTVDYDMFRSSLEGDNNMVIFLDGMDEINPYYFETVCLIIQAIRAEFHVQLWVSTRTILNEQMKKYFEQEFWTLAEFTLDEAKQFLNKYCGEKFCNLGETEEKLCVIPLFCKMIGDVINGSNLKHSVDAIKSKVDLFDKFIEVKFQVYYEKNKVNTSAPATRIEMKKNKEKTMKNFEIIAVWVIFGKDRMSESKWNIKAECKDVLDSLSEGIEYLGVVSKIKDDKPIFIHQSFAEYFCGHWFARNRDRYKEYVVHPGNSRYSFPAEVDYFMSSMINNTNSLFSLILNTEEEDELENSLGKYTDKFNELDPIGRDVLHYANLVNNYKASKYIFLNGYNLTEENVAEIDLYKPYITTLVSAKLVLTWLASNFKKYPQYRPLLGLLLLYNYIQDTAPYFLLEYSRNSPLHVAILSQCKEDIIHFEEENLNSKDELGLTPLHVAAFMKDEDAIKLLANHRAEYSRDNKLGVYPHQLITRRSEEVYNLLKQFYGSFMEEDCLKADIMAEDYVARGLPLHNAVQRKELRKYLENNSDLNSIRIGPDSKGRSFLHVAAASSCNEIFGESWKIVERHFKYTRDDNGYFPHHYTDDSNLENRLRNIGIGSICSCLAPDDLSIHGFHYVDLLNKMLPTPKDDDGGLLLHLLLRSSVWLKLVNEDPADRLTTSQNVKEFCDLYDVVFRSKYKPPGQDKRLLKQYRALNIHMFSKYRLAFDKLNDEDKLLIIRKESYFDTFIKNIVDLFKEDSENLFEQTLEKLASVVHAHMELMSENEEGHLRDCSCLKQLKIGGEAARNT